MERSGIRDFPAGTETTLDSCPTDDRLASETAGGVARTTRYTYDANGRLIQKAAPGEVALYAWDSEDHLIAVKRGASAQSATIQATYAYDGDGNRVTKIEKTAQGDQTTVCVRVSHLG